MLFYSHLGWRDEQAPTLTAALEYVRDHCALAHGKGLTFSLTPGNSFGAEAKAAIKKAVERPDGRVQLHVSTRQEWGFA